MAQYTIDLPGNLNGYVRKGKVFKKATGLFKQWPWIRFSTEVRTGYLIAVEDVLYKDKKEYHLLKTKDGKWLPGEENELNTAIKIQGKWQPLSDDQATLAIKKAIDDYENEQ